MPNDHSHVAEGALAAYADDPASLTNRSAVEEHLAACATCRTAVDELRVMTAAMQDEETWWIVDEMVTGEGQQALQEFAERIEAEDEEAKQLLKSIVESEYLFSYANIWRRKRFHTGGVVRVLCERAWEECPREPHFALVLAEAAYAIADALPNDYYPAGVVNELRGRAWKEYSTACRYLGDFQGGFDALARAERGYRQLIDPAVHLATLDLARAALLWEQQCYDEALPFARAAAQVFTDRRDMKRYLKRRNGKP